MSTTSYFQAVSGDRFVTVWPSATDESAFYDVTYGPIDGDDVSRSSRITAREAACYIITELGAAHGATIDDITRQIAEWRKGHDLRVRVEREPVR